MRKPERQVPWEARFKAAQPADQALLSPVLLLPQAGLSRGTGNRSAQWAQLVIDAGTPLSPRSSSGSTESDGGGGGKAPLRHIPWAASLCISRILSLLCPLSPGPLWVLIRQLETLRLRVCYVTELGFEPRTSAPVHRATCFCTVCLRSDSDSEDPESGPGRRQCGLLQSVSKECFLQP